MITSLHERDVYSLATAKPVLKLTFKGRKRSYTPYRYVDKDHVFYIFCKRNSLITRLHLLLWILLLFTVIKSATSSTLESELLQGCEPSLKNDEPIQEVSRLILLASRIEATSEGWQQRSSVSDIIRPKYNTRRCCTVHSSARLPCVSKFAFFQWWKPHRWCIVAFFQLFSSLPWSDFILCFRTICSIVRVLEIFVCFLKFAFLLLFLTFFFSC